MNYDVDFFIAKFYSIPEDRWTANKQSDEEGRRCAYGHCYPSDAKRSKYTNNLCGEIPAEGEVLIFLFQQIDGRVAQVNNGGDKRYQQPHPKQRILAALYDIKKLQQPKYKDITKDLASVLPIEEVSDIKIGELIKEKIL